MNNKGSIALIALLIALGVVLVGGGIWYVSTKPFNISGSPTSNTTNSTSSITETSLSEDNVEFCNKIKAKTQELKSVSPPGTYIEQSQNKELLKIWKDSFVRYNQITEEYFNNHIKIESDAAVKIPHLMTSDPTHPNPDLRNVDSNKNLDEYLQINYFFIVDWVSIPLKDGFVIKYQDSEAYLSADKIKSTIEKYMNVEGRTKTNIGIGWIVHISYVRDHEGKEDINELKNHGKIIDSVVSCEDIIKTLTKREETLIPNQIGFYDRSFVIRASGNINNKNETCPTTSIGLVSGNIYYYYGQPCVING